MPIPLNREDLDVLPAGPPDAIRICGRDTRGSVSIRALVDNQIQGGLDVVTFAYYALPKA